MDKYLIIVAFLLVVTACESDSGNSNEAPIVSLCDQNIWEDENLYLFAPADELHIQNLEIVGDCLSISFSASGCDGLSWEVKLIDSEQILESFPVQRNLRLSLQNMEECDAVISKTILFNLLDMQLPNEPKIIFNLVNTGEQVLYEYE